VQETSARGVAIGAGLFVVKHTTFGTWLQVRWHDGMAWFEKQVPPEDLIKQAKIEIGKIDAEIRRNIGHLAQQEADYRRLEKMVKDLDASQTQLKEDVTAMEKLLTGSKTELVAFNGATYRPSELTRKLDGALTLYTSRKAELKAREQLLGEKKLALEAAHQRIGAMRDRKEQLNVNVARLETSVQRLREKQTKTGIAFDESQISKVNELISKLEDRVAKEESENKFLAEFGFRKPADATEAKSTEEVLKAARKALEDGDAVTAKQ
jgi:chromosome segregation ATPase